ncbi:MOSC domain-containing protein [Pelagibacterium xiamenense]|uniref:MOSC domain-containing protein n=1 Tax=Pelagibacterium xiamenense TaxID=2901140 RepID=UPI001E5C6162|nr:MOSC domain-containing protein [Pelagibacterium xiamenense]MCD7060257.1 MOSC domain-containing protein [Pelagibacterium xiamenense]
MKIVSINIGRPEPIDPRRPEVRTGIYKRPVEGPVAVTRLGIAKDAVVDTHNHGGPDQALYLYSSDDYRWWADQGVATEPGQFGENLTVSGLESSTLCIGDRLIAGGVEMEVTAPRIPCAKFAAKMGDPGFVKRFRDAARPGAYLRVIAQGQLEAGQALRLVPFAGDRLTLEDHFELVFMKTLPGRDVVERLLALPIAERARNIALAWRAAHLDNA